MSMCHYVILQYNAARCRAARWRAARLHAARDHLTEISLFISSLSPKNNSRMTKAELTYVIFDVMVRLRNFLRV
jgi:hypothetical protein